MSSRWILLFGIGAALAGAASLSADNTAASDESVEAISGPRINKGFEISPVPLALQGRNRGLVGLGSYLVNAVGGCNDCHTHPSFAPGGDPYLGETTIINSEQYLTGGRQFGPFTSANLTPDEFGRPHGLTFPEFKNVIRTGHDPDEPDEILQVMPWPVYANMTNWDLRAIYEFLSAIPSRPDNPNPGP